MQCGPIRYKVDAKEQAEKRPFEHYLIPRFTSFRSAADKTITAIYKELSENQLRNNLIANDVIEALCDGRTPIILTERREHIETLSGLLSGKCDNIITLFGTSSQDCCQENVITLSLFSEQARKKKREKHSQSLNQSLTTKNLLSSPPENMLAKGLIIQGLILFFSRCRLHGKVSAADCMER